MEFERFEELEAKVKELLDKYRNIKGEKEKLIAEIKIGQQKIDELERKVRDADEKRTKAMERVDELIGLFETSPEENAN